MPKRCLSKSCKFVSETVSGYKNENAGMKIDKKQIKCGNVFGNDLPFFTNHKQVDTNLFIFLKQFDKNIPFSDVTNVAKFGKKKPQKFHKLIN